MGSHMEQYMTCYLCGSCKQFPLWREWIRDFPLNFTEVINGTTSAFKVIQVSFNLLAKVPIDDRLSPCDKGGVSLITNIPYYTQINASGKVERFMQKFKDKSPWLFNVDSCWFILFIQLAQSRKLVDMVEISPFH